MINVGEEREKVREASRKKLIGGLNSSLISSEGNIQLLLQSSASKALNQLRSHSVRCSSGGRLTNEPVKIAICIYNNE